MKQRHYYRFDILSTLGSKFKTFWKSCEDAERAADIWADKAGAKTYYSSPSAFAGGVQCVSFGENVVPDPRIWRSLGPDMDGIEQFEPLCEHQRGVMMLPRKTFKPSNTNTRLFSERLNSWKEVKHLYPMEHWARLAGLKKVDEKEIEERIGDESFVQFMEICREDFTPDPNNKRKKMNHIQRTAVDLERTRMALPIVPVQVIYHLLQADTSVTGNKVVIAQDSTPTFFKTGRRFYVAIDYPCTDSCLEEVTKKEYDASEQAALEKMNKKKGKKA